MKWCVQCDLWSEYEVSVYCWKCKDSLVDLWLSVIEPIDRIHYGILRVYFNNVFLRCIKIKCLCLTLEIDSACIHTPVCFSQHGEVADISMQCHASCTTLANLSTYSWAVGSGEIEQRGSYVPLPRKDCLVSWQPLHITPPSISQIWASGGEEMHTITKSKSRNIQRHPQ